MGNLVTTLNTPAPSGGSAIYVPEADLRYFVGYEQSATAHWIFDQGADGLTDLVGEIDLILQDAAPSYSANYLSVPVGDGDALQLPFEDTANAVDTLCMVFRTSHASLQMLMGNLSRDAFGGSPFIGAPPSTMFLTYRGVADSVDTDINIAASTWYFLSIARDFSGGTKRLRAFVGAQPGFQMTSGGTYAPSTDNQGVANTSYTLLGPGSIDVAEMIYFDGRALSLADSAAVYARAKARQTAKGNAVV